MKIADKCPICGEHGQLYYEGYDYPEWIEQHYTDRDRPVGNWFCTVEHMVQWLLNQGFDISRDSTNKDSE